MLDLLSKQLKQESALLPILNHLVSIIYIHSNACYINKCRKNINIMNFPVLSYHTSGCVPSQINYFPWTCNLFYAGIVKCAPDSFRKERQRAGWAFRYKWHLPFKVNDLCLSVSSCPPALTVRHWSTWRGPVETWAQAGLVKRKEQEALGSTICSARRQINASAKDCIYILGFSVFSPFKYNI